MRMSGPWSCTRDAHSFRRRWIACLPPHTFMSKPSCRSSPTDPSYWNNGTIVVGCIQLVIEWEWVARWQSCAVERHLYIAKRKKKVHVQLAKALKCFSRSVLALWLHAPIETAKYSKEVPLSENSYRCGPVWSCPMTRMPMSYGRQPYSCVFTWASDAARQIHHRSGAGEMMHCR